MKKEDPERYKIMREKLTISQRVYRFINREKYNEWRKKDYIKNREKYLEYNKRFYQKMKIENPEKYKKHNEKVYAYMKKRYHNDPEFRKKHLEYDKRYREKMKIEDPERYKQMFHKYGFISKTVSGYKCLNCGFGIKTNTSLGKRKQVKCPNCRKVFHGGDLEKIRVPRIIPKGYVKVPSSTNYQLPSDTMENLRNFYNLKVKIKEEKISDDDIFDAVDEFER